MKLKYLREDETDNTTQQEVNTEASETTIEQPTEVKNVDWEQKFKNAKTVDAQNTAIKDYLKSRFPNLQNALKPITETLIKILRQLGLNENTNPFIKFIELFFKGEDKPLLNNNNMICINNLYANKIINDRVLKGLSEDQTEHPIFSRNLYQQGNKDIEYIIKCYNWLSNTYDVVNSVTNFNLKIDNRDIKLSIKRDDKSNDITFNLATNEGLRNFKKFVIFINGEFAKGVRQSRDIESIIVELDNAPSQPKGDNDKKSFGVKTTIKDNDRWTNLADKENLTAEQAEDLIAALVQKFSLK